jgi:hypothetical protein
MRKDTIRVVFGGGQGDRGDVTRGNFIRTSIISKGMVPSFGNVQ